MLCRYDFVGVKVRHADFAWQYSCLARVDTPEIIATLENLGAATEENATTILQLLNDQSTNFGGMFDQLTEHLASRQKQADKNTATIKDAVHAQTKRETPI